MPKLMQTPPVSHLIVEARNGKEHSITDEAASIVAAAHINLSYKVQWVLAGDNHWLKKVSRGPTESRCFNDAALLSPFDNPKEAFVACAMPRTWAICHTFSLDHWSRAEAFLGRHYITVAWSFKL